MHQLLGVRRLHDIMFDRRFSVGSSAIASVFAAAIVADFSSMDATFASWSCAGVNGILGSMHIIFALVAE